MRILTILPFLLLTTVTFSQNISVAPKDHPFIQIIEWKGMGGLLLSQSPKEYMNQINLSLVGDAESELWNQKFNPNNHTPYYLFNENTNYIYFIDNLDLVNNGRILFSQINSAGNAKSGTLDVGLKVKRMEGYYDYNKFEFQDAGVTDKALFTLYRYYDKKEKEYHEFAMFMTHHNMTHYVIKLGHVEADKIKGEQSGQWNYIGFNDEIIHFSWRELKVDIPGWTIKGFSPKGELTSDLFLEEPEQIIPFINFGYGNSGKYYIEDENRFGVETGLISFINNEYYLLAIQEQNGSNEITLFHLVNEKWVKLNSAPTGDINEKSGHPFLGSFAVNEGVTYHYKHDEKDVVGILFFDKEKEGKQEPFTKQSAFNPSRLIHDCNQNEFITEINEKIIACNLSQLERQSGVLFEIR